MSAAALSIFATFLAILVALFKEDIRSWWHRPKLTAQLRLSPPDCHKTELVVKNPSSGQVLKRGDCYYFRIWVENEGKERADKVQVFVASLLRKHADGKFKEETSFLPMNLRWSHSYTPEIFADAISPGMGKHCDFGHVVDPALRISGFMDDSNLPAVPPTKIIFELDLEVKPYTMSHLLKPGEYVLVLKLAAANSRPVEKRLRINLNGDWFSDERKMFADGIGITELS